jgi:hypothetical protein
LSEISVATIHAAFRSLKGEHTTEPFASADAADG